MAKTEPTIARMLRSGPSSPSRQLGYPGLLNLQETPHHTIFLTDFALPVSDIARLRAELAGAPTDLFFYDIARGVEGIRADLAGAGVRLSEAYASVHAFTTTEEGLSTAKALFAGLSRGDFARIELPSLVLGFEPAQASFLIDIVMNADYGQQDMIASLFFDCLGQRSPYEVIVHSPGATLKIQDTAPWFELGGRLRAGEQRILPGGETAYVGSAINGSLTIDGAILAVPQRPRASPLARRLMPLSARLGEDPATFHIENGQITDITSRNGSASLLLPLLEDAAYRQITEVGISFNRACATYVHDWPAACNEGRPGVHIAIGGDPDPSVPKDADNPLVHIDLMAATTEVVVNDNPFLKTFA